MKHDRKTALAILAVVACAAVGMTVQAIPLSVLEDQACLKARIEVTLKALPDVRDLRGKVVAELREYMASIQANIDQCNREVAKAGNASERKEWADAVKEYEADMKWAQQAMKEAVRR